MYFLLINQQFGILKVLLNNCFNRINIKIKMNMFFDENSLKNI